MFEGTKIDFMFVKCEIVESCGAMLHCTTSSDILNAVSMWVLGKYYD